MDPRPQVRGPCFNGREMITGERERVRGSGVAREAKGKEQMSETGGRATGRSGEGTGRRRRKEITQEGIDGIGGGGTRGARGGSAGGWGEIAGMPRGCPITHQRTRV